MDGAAPWERWVALIEPFDYDGKKGPKAQAAGDDAAHVPVAGVVLVVR